MPDFLPRPDVKLLEWSRNFDQKIAVSYADYGLSALQAEAFGQANALFAAQYQRANDPVTRTRPAIAAKDDAREAMKTLARELAALVRANRVTDTQRLELGLRVEKKTRTRIGEPTGAPNVNVIDVRGSRVRIRLSDPESPHRLAKPKGVHGAIIYMCAAEDPATGIRQWSYLKQIRRTRETVRIRGNVRPGTPIWIAAQWFNPRGQRGPIGRPASTHVQFAEAQPPGAMKLAA